MRNCGFIEKCLHHKPQLDPCSLSDVFIFHLYQRGSNEFSVYFTGEVVLRLVPSADVEGHQGKVNRVGRGGATWVGEMKERTHQWSWQRDERVLWLSHSLLHLWIDLNRLRAWIWEQKTCLLCTLLVHCKNHKCKLWKIFFFFFIPTRLQICLMKEGISSTWKTNKLLTYQVQCLLPRFNEVRAEC